MKSGKGSDAMMACLYGGKKGYHLSENGLALQLYAFGYAMVPDAAAYESYWSKDHAYHQSATGSNTILPGYTHGPIQIQAMEPFVEETAFVNTDALTPFLNWMTTTICFITSGVPARLPMSRGMHWTFNP